MYIKEVAASLYPWDLADEGVETCVDNVVEHSLVNSVYLVGIMHKEKRPLTSLFFTHNPKRKFYLPEDSRVYYPMDENNFKNTPLKPLYTTRDFLKGRDWLEELTVYGRKRNLKTGAEISHSFFDCEVAKKEFPDVLQKNIHGGIIENYFCCNNDDVREYMKAIYYDTVKNHDIDFIQTCMRLFAIGEPVKAPWFMENDPHNKVGTLLGVVKGGCFCNHCREKATNQGYDWDKIVSDLKELELMANATASKNLDYVMDNHLLMGGDLLEAGFLLENPSLHLFLEFRMKSVTGLLKEINESIKAANSKVDFRYNNYLRYPELAGLDYVAVKDYLDSVRDSDYSEQLGAPDHFKRKKNTILKIRRGIGYDKDLIAAFAPRPNATPELVRESIRILSTLGVDGLSLGHYDGATFELLDAVKQGMQEAGIEIRR
ncbi:hypothetical protein [Paenibacillus agricola]|uniref:Uncharacterized protein n=1 Tax=Paenibacillus agricola TaxID=2716264 RepID=A0ABX0JI94_9BACL|nr:hypothetical protein [Paenibacillus agricola]NHN34149.1 hypothetical protein [Paenibacillus agricola]